MAIKLFIKKLNPIVMNSFIENIPTEDKEAIYKLKEIIIKKDPKVKEEIGSLMSSKGTLNYLEDGVFKYSLAKTEKHYSFHSMVMYTYPEIGDLIKKKSKSLKVQKGCINFKKATDFEPGIFEEMMEISATKDFSSVIDYYKKKKND